MGQQIQKQCPGVQWRVMDLGQIWSLSCVGPIQVDSFPCNTFLRRPAKEELLEDNWDVCSIPGRICRNPLLSKALLELWKKKVEHPLILYLSEDGRLGINSGLGSFNPDNSSFHTCAVNWIIVPLLLSSHYGTDGPRSQQKPSLLRPRTCNRLGVFR